LGMRRIVRRFGREPFDIVSNPFAFNHYELLRMDEKSRKSVVLRRPLGEDTSVMRTSALTSMMEVVRSNWSNRNLEGRFFEIAREYFPTGENQLPVERD
ncbi:hypothetical protein PZH37_18985, partial [[Eubacterium] siraeum]|nr:hypothetical protein [[Eubacterium] siraeum]